MSVVVYMARTSAKNSAQVELKMKTMDERNTLDIHDINIYGAKPATIFCAV